MKYPIGVIRRSEQSFLRAKLLPLGICPLEGKILSCIYQTQDCNQDMVCTQLDLDAGRVAKSLAKLEQLGYITRRVNPKNKREKLMHMTPQGEELFQTLCGVFQEWSDICLEGFTPQEREQYSAFIQRIAENAAAYRREEKHNG
jgi:MarR family transcriptional regulator for hemolysin